MSRELEKVEKKEIVALAKNAKNALERCEHVTKIWTHSRSSMTLKNITIGKEYSPLRQMRQVAAELQRKKQAMLEAKYKILKNKKKAEIKRDKAESESNQLKKEYLELQAEELDVMCEGIKQPYIGAMREVMELSILHDALEKKIRNANNGRLDEEVFEQEEAKYWVKRSFAQSLRDMRQSGRISTGNQELLEQIGLDPFVVKKILICFLEGNQDDENPSSHNIEDFLTKCSDDYSIAASAKIKRMGLPCEIATKHLMLERTED